MIKLFEDFVNESFKFTKYVFNSHKNHNPDYDILEGHIDADSYITYVIKVTDKGTVERGVESMEYYTGENYKVGSKKKSNSRRYEVDKIPTKYKNAWLELKDKYEKEYK